MFTGMPNWVISSVIFIVAPLFHTNPEGRSDMESDT